MQLIEITVVALVVAILCLGLIAIFRTIESVRQEEEIQELEEEKKELKSKLDDTRRDIQRARVHINDLEVYDRDEDGQFVEIEQVPGIHE